MIPAIVILVCGVLLAVLGVLVRKRLGQAWMISILVAGILLGGCGGCFLYGEYSQTQEMKQTLYLGLRYLDQQELEPAGYYLKQVDASESFTSAAARTLLEKVQGNVLSGRLNLDIADSMAKSDEEKSLVNLIRDMVPESMYEDSYHTVVSQLTRQLKLSDRRQETMDLFASIESGAYLEEDELKRLGISEDEAARLRISADLGNNSFGSAVSEAVRLVDEHPTEENRLLLAEAVAEAGYVSYPLTSWYFSKEEAHYYTGSISPLDLFFEGNSVTRTVYGTDGYYYDDGYSYEQPEDPDPSVQKELDDLNKKMEKAQEKLDDLELTIQGTEDKDTLQKLNEQKLDLTKEIEGYQRRGSKLFVYRAFNAIADLNSIEAKIVRARLWFALLDYEKAVDTIRDAATSLQTKVSTDDSLKRKLQIVENTYESDDTFYESAQFTDAMNSLLTAPFPDLMHISYSNLTRDFTSRIISDQKSYGNSLAMSGLDLSQFPKITLKLSGRADILDKIVQKEGIVARDTRQDVTYTATLEEGTSVDIVMLLDRSGSMSGEPLQNLKQAVSDFIDDMESGTRLSLVAFDDYAERLTELTDSKADLSVAISGLYDGGGTEITAGIREGIDVLSTSAGNRTIVLMTDGQSNIDESVVQEAADQGIAIYTVGFGSVNDVLLQYIADTTGGQYVRADSSAELSNVYASLQQIIGNVLTFEYTATETEETFDRYFYLDVDSYTIYREYTLEEPEERQPALWYASPSIIDPDTIERAKDNNNTISVYLNGYGLENAESVTIGGEEAEVTDVYNDGIRVNASPWSGDGFAAVEVTLVDGTVLSADQLIYVGESTRFRNLRLGSLFISSAYGVDPGDGTIILSDDGFGISEFVEEDEESSLNLTYYGTLILPAPPPVEEEGDDDTDTDNDEPRPNYTDLGDSGTMSGYGAVYINYDDGAYLNNVSTPNLIAEGQLEFRCEPDQSELVVLSQEEVAQP